MFYKKVNQKYFESLQKNTCSGDFFGNVADPGIFYQKRGIFHQKRNFTAGAFLWIFQNFSNHGFYRSALRDWFCRNYTFFTPHYDTSEGYIRTRKFVINSSEVLRADAEKICTKKKFSIKYPFRKYDRIRRKYLVTFTEEILNGKLHFLSNGTWVKWINLRELHWRSSNRVNDISFYYPQIIFLLYTILCFIISAVTKFSSKCRAK